MTYYYTRESQNDKTPATRDGVRYANAPRILNLYE